MNSAAGAGPRNRSAARAVIIEALDSLMSLGLNSDYRQAMDEQPAIVSAISQKHRHVYPRGDVNRVRVIHRLCDSTAQLWGRDEPAVVDAGIATLLWALTRRGYLPTWSCSGLKRDHLHNALDRIFWIPSRIRIHSA